MITYRSRTKRKDYNSSTPQESTLKEFKMKNDQLNLFASGLHSIPITDDLVVGKKGISKTEADHIASYFDPSVQDMARRFFLGLGKSEGSAQCWFFRFRKNTEKEYETDGKIQTDSGNFLLISKKPLPNSIKIENLSGVFYVKPVGTTTGGVTGFNNPGRPIANYSYKGKKYDLKVTSPVKAKEIMGTLNLQLPEGEDTSIFYPGAYFKANKSMSEDWIKAECNRFCALLPCLYVNSSSFGLKKEYLDYACPNMTIGGYSSVMKTCFSAKNLNKLSEKYDGLDLMYAISEMWRWGSFSKSAEKVIDGNIKAKSGRYIHMKEAFNGYKY